MVIVVRVSVDIIYLRWALIIWAQYSTADSVESTRFRYSVLRNELSNNFYRKVNEVRNRFLSLRIRSIQRVWYTIFTESLNNI